MRRAQIVLHALEGLKAPEISARMELCGATVRHWLKRFNARGLEGLEEDVRSGRPPTYSAEQRSAVINAALSRPAELGLPFACWTLDRLVAYLSEQGIAMRRSRLSEIFIQEGLKWRQEETWFGERVDPDFARKRGRSSSSTRRHRPAASSSASTRWDRRPARATQASGSSKPAGPKAERAKQEIDYGRRGTAGYVFGALQPATGEAFTLTYERRTTANWVDFLSAVERWIDPAVERVYAVLDNLNVHSAPDVLLFGLLHPRWEFVFQPKYAAYLNLIEPWWKVLRSLALKGRRFEAWAEIEAAVGARHRLLERAPAPVRLGPAATPSAAAPPRASPPCQILH